MGASADDTAALRELSAETSKTEKRTKTEIKPKAETIHGLLEDHMTCVCARRGSTRRNSGLFKGTEEILETMMMENFPQINVRHETTGPEAQGTRRKNAPKPLYPGISFSKEGNTEKTVTREADANPAVAVITLNITGLNVK